jgi:hypothetical protein
MTDRPRPLFLWIFILVLAPIAAAVVVAALLLFGVGPHLVFAPGQAIQSLLHAGGFHAPNSVGVVTTVGLWWAIIVAIGFLWDRRHLRKSA